MSIFPSQVWRLIVKYKIGTWFHSAPNLRAGVKMKWTLQPAVPSCFWHIQQKQTKTNRISRFDGENGRFRQVPPHMLALVAQLLSNANIQPLQRSESVLTFFHNTTAVHKISSCSPRIAWLCSLWGAWNVINPDSARLTEVFLLLNRGILNRGIQGVRKNEKMQGEGVSKFENEESMKLAELAEDSSWCQFFLHTCEDWSLDYKIGTWFHSAPNLRAGVKMKWTLQPAVPSCFWHIQQKQTKTNRTSRPDRENGRFRQVPPHMLALVAQLLSNAKFSHCSALRIGFDMFSQHHCGP